MASPQVIACRAALAAVLSLLAASPLSAEVTTAIRLNTLGYLPDALKVASVSGGAGANFKLLRVRDGSTVVAGRASDARRNEDTDELLATVDFSAMHDPGEYRLEVDEVGASASFHIDADLYREPFRLVTRGMYLLRCGTAVSAEYSGHTFAHAPCHLNDGYLDLVGGGHEKRTATGGWHDAGDYNKYVVNAGVTVGVMLRAWEDFQKQIEPIKLDLPEAGGPLPEFLAEVKWELDWLLLMQTYDGSVFHKMSTKDYGAMILPEREQAERYFGSWSTDATADFVAMMSMASRHYRKYDPAFADRCLAAAQKAYDFLDAHPEAVRADQRGFTTVGYESDDWSARLWADAEYWEATGDATALAALESRLKSPNGDQSTERRRRGPYHTSTFDVDWDWANVKNLGLLTYLTSTREGRDAALVDSVRTSLIEAADSIVADADRHGYARPSGTRYYWGCNGSTARHTLVLEAAARATNNNAYRNVELDALNHLLGRNVYGRSFVTGLGYLPPLHPHDRRSWGDDVDAPWPGYLVGGPHPKATSWHDDQADYQTNEIAINWNGALIYALAAQLKK